MSVKATEHSLARVVISGAGLIVAAGAVSKVFSLATAPVLTRVLGPSPYGVVSLLSTVTAFAGTASLLGIDHSYSRFFFSGKGENRDAVEKFCWRFSAGATGVVSLLAGLGWWWWSGRAGLPPELAVMVAAGVLLSTLRTMGTTRQRLRGRYSRIAVAIVAAGGCGALFAIAIAVFLRADAWALLGGSAGGVAVGVAIMGLPGSRDLTGKSGLSSPQRWEIIRLGLAGATIAPMYWLMNSADRWFIGMWHGQEALGVYSFAMSIGTIGIMVNNAITVTWFPEMTRVYEDSREEAPAQLGRMWARLAAGLLVMWLAITAAGGDVIRLLADRRFHPGAAYVPWIAGGIFFYGICSLANTGLLLRKDLNPVAGWWLLGALANLFLNYLLVRPMGAAGAAVAACLGFAFVAAGVMSSAQARLRLVVPWERLAAAAGLALAAGVAMHLPWAGTAALSLALKFPVGVVCAAALMRITAPDWFDRLVRGEFVRWPGRRRNGS